MSSINDIINQINSLAGTSIPPSSTTSGSLSPAPYTTAASYTVSTAPSGTISTAGIYPGSIITSEQILRIINALNGTSTDTIIISGSLLTSGSSVINGTLALPFVGDGNFLFVTGGLVTGSTAIMSASFATSASYATTASLALFAMSASSASTASLAVSATSASYAATASLPLLGIVTASVLATTITFTKGDATTFDLVIAQSGSVESASYANFAQNAATASNAINSLFALSSSLAETASYVNLAQTASYVVNAVSASRAISALLADTASYVLNAVSSSFATSARSASYALTASYLEGLNFATYQISTGSITASVNVGTASIFLIQSASLPFLDIASNSNTTIYSDLFIIKSFTSQQPVLTVSGSIVNIATHSIDPTGYTNAGNIYFTSGAMYIGLE